MLYQLSYTPLDPLKINPCDEQRAAKRRRPTAPQAHRVRGPVV